MSSSVLVAAVLAMFAWGSAAIFDKLALNAMRGMSPLTAVIVRMFFAVLAVCTIGMFGGAMAAIAQMRPITFVHLGLSALFAAVIGQAAYYYAANAGQVSRVVGFTAGYPLVTVLVAVLVLSEPLTAQKLVGTVMVVSGLIILAVWRRPRA